MPYILADHGYEVWLGNNRGNGVSMGHIKYTPNDPQFWNFTWSDMARYDLPAQLNHVLARSNQSRAYYIGHSEGTIQAFAALIEQPSLADMLHLYVALAPVAYVGTRLGPWIRTRTAAPWWSSLTRGIVRQCRVPHSAGHAQAGRG